MTTQQSAPNIVPLRNLAAWKPLELHYGELRNSQLRELFAKDSKHADSFTPKAVSLYFDYSKNRVTDDSKQRLIEFADRSGFLQAHSERHRHLYRRIRSGSCDGLRGFEVLQPARMTFSLVSTLDGAHIVDATRDLNADETLFMISSKTFPLNEEKTEKGRNQ